MQETEAKTEEKIYKLVDGKTIEMTPEEIAEEEAIQEEIARIGFPLEKEERIKQLKTNCSNYIYSKYPIYKQLNIANGIEDKKTELQIFVETTRLVCNAREELLKQAINREELYVVDINFGVMNNDEQ